MSVPFHSRSPLGRAGAALNQIQLIERSGALIGELGIELDRKLEGEARASERMRMLRETTNRITRAANDAVAAYRLALRSVDAEVARGGPRVGAAMELRTRLHAARAALLGALETANRRYPWADGERASPDVAGAGAARADAR